MTLTEKFIYLHFNHIYEEICKGATNQNRDYFQHLKDVDGREIQLGIPSWDIKADKQDVLKSITTFLHLCLNAHKYNAQFRDIEEWTNTLLKIACADYNHGVVSGFAFRVLMNSSEQFTRYFFELFDWDIETENDTFDSRIQFYTKKFYSFPKNNYYKSIRNSKELLYAMKAQRNPGSHLAQHFYEDRPATLQRLTYHLYDYITIFYIIRHVFNIDITKTVFTLIGDPIDLSKIHLKVTCSDRKEEIKEVLLCMVNKYGKREYLDKEAGSLNSSATFWVNRFCNYSISLRFVDDSRSGHSELFSIDEGYPDGSEIYVTIPPSKVNKPEVRISELVLFSESELPDDLRYVLNKLDEYSGQGQEYVTIARTLTMASATGCERDKQAFLHAVADMRAEIDKQHDEDILNYLKESAQKIQELLSAPYKKEDVKLLFQRIDEMFDRCLELASPLPEHEDMSIIDQLKANVEHFLQGDMLVTGNTASERCVQIEKDLTLLSTIITISDSHPDIIEAEFGDKYSVFNKIEEIYVDSINQHFTIIEQLRKSANVFLNQIHSQATKQTEQDEIALIYAGMLEKVMFISAEHLLHFVMFGHNLLVDWINRCVQSYSKLKESADSLILEINKIKNRPENQTNSLRIISLNEEEKLQVQEICKSIRDIIFQLTQSRKEFEKHFSEITQEELQRPKKLSLRIMEKMGVASLAPNIQSDILSRERFASLDKLFSQHDPGTIRQLAWADELGSISDLLNCSLLGVSPNGLYGEWANYWQQWNKKNEETIQLLQEKYKELNHTGAIRPRERHLRNLFADKSDVLKAEAKIIVTHQIETIRHRYVDNEGNACIPTYINDIIEAKERTLPDHAKAMMLRWVLNPEIKDIVKLLLLFDEIEKYYSYSENNSRALLGKYIWGDYAKQLFSSETASTIDSELTPYFIYEYISDLLTKRNIAGRDIAYNYAMATGLYLTHGHIIKDYITPHDFFAKVAKYHLPAIYNYDYKELEFYNTLLDVVNSYCMYSPSDEEVIALHKDQCCQFENVCKAYYEKHLHISPFKPATKIKNVTDIMDFFQPSIPDDIKIPHFISLIPQKSEAELTSAIEHHYALWAYGSVTVTDSTQVVPTLQSLRQLIEKYGQHIEIPLNEAPTSFVDILLLIHNKFYHKILC